MFDSSLLYDLDHETNLTYLLHKELERCRGVGGSQVETLTVSLESLDWHDPIDAEVLEHLARMFNRLGGVPLPCLCHKQAREHFTVYVLPPHSLLSGYLLACSRCPAMAYLPVDEDPLGSFWPARVIVAPNIDRSKAPKL
jgi:hypothetical protein